MVRSASIRGANGHSAAGTAQIVRTGDTYLLQLGNDFRIDIGSVDVYLTNRTDTNGGGVNLGSLRSLTGAQSFPMPNDGSGYRYVLLWCRPFGVPVGLGELR